MSRAIPVAVIVLIVVASVLAAQEYTPSSASGVKVVLASTAGKALHGKPAELYVLKAVKIDLNRKAAEKLLSILGYRASLHHFSLNSKGIRYLERKHGFLLDFSWSWYGPLRFYRAAYRPPTGNASISYSGIEEKAGRILSGILQVLRGVGLDASEWSFQLKRVDSDTIVYADIASGKRITATGRVYAVYEAYYHGVPVYGLYRAEFLPNGTTAGLFLDIYRLELVEKIEEQNILSPVEALRANADLDMLARTAGTNTLKILEAKLVYEPLATPRGLYLIPVYIIRVEGVNGRIHVPAVLTKLTYSLLKTMLQASSHAETTTTATEAKTCSKTIGLQDIAEVIEKKRGEITTYTPENGSEKIREAYRALQAITRAGQANPCLCYYPGEKLPPSLEKERNWVEIVFRKPAELELKLVSGNTECIESVAAVAIGETHFYVKVLGGKGESSWLCFFYR